MEEFRKISERRSILVIGDPLKYSQYGLWGNLMETKQFTLFDEVPDEENDGSKRKEKKKTDKITNKKYQ